MQDVVVVSMCFANEYKTIQVIVYSTQTNGKQLDGRCVLTVVMLWKFWFSYDTRIQKYSDLLNGCILIMVIQMIRNVYS